MDHWRYRQLLAFLRTLSRPLRDLSELNSIELIFKPQQPPSHAISQFYKALIDSQNQSHPNFLHKWELDLGSQISDAQKDKILALAHISSTSTKVAESNYKLLSRWYYTPLKLHAISPSSSPLCWRGCGDTASHAHIWWHCPLVKPFWSEVLRLTHDITGETLSSDPWTVLLHCTTKPTLRYKRSLTPHLLNSAKALIPVFWNSPTIPTIGRWLRKIDETYHFEELSYIFRDKLDSFLAIWSPWSTFRTTSLYLSILASDVSG